MPCVHLLRLEEMLRVLNQGDGQENTGYWGSLVCADIPQPLPCPQVPNSLMSTGSLNHLLKRFALLTLGLCEGFLSLLHSSLCGGKT